MALAHNNFRFSFASAPALIQSARANDVRRALVADYFGSVLVGLEVHHHGEEELLFPLLIERFPEERDKVDLGEKQHHEVVSLLAVAQLAVTEWEANGDAHSGNVEAALGALEDALLIHLDYEEATIVPLEARLSVEERKIYMARTRKHHAERLRPSVGEFFFSISHIQPLLWEAVGAASFRDMIARSMQPG